MKKALFLHIGMGKTGTTALQDFFWANRRTLRRRGIAYPRYGMVARAHHLLSPYIPLEQKDAWRFKAVSQWARKLQRAGQRKILLSSELMAWAAAPDVEQFCRALSQWFDITVVIYLRRQDNMVVANYNQLVKAGSQQHDLERDLEDSPDRFDYGRIIRPWAEAIGRDHIIVRPYERTQFFGGDIRWDFLHHVFGIDEQQAFFLPPGNPNPGFSLAAMEYKLQLNKLFDNAINSSKYNKLLLSYTAESGDSGGGMVSLGSALSPARRLDILERFHASNAAIAREFLGREDGALFCESEPDQAISGSRQALSQAEAHAITRYIQSRDRKAYQRLVTEVRRGGSSSNLARMEASRFFRPYLPTSAFVKAADRTNRRSASVFRFRRDRTGDPLLLVSVHFPGVTVAGYESALQQQFGDHIVRDYDDRPMRKTGLQRNMDALASCAQLAGMVGETGQYFCVHGHFMPLKYLLLSASLQKRFVTWMQHPVDRLVSQYTRWKNAADTGVVGHLHRRMIEQDWSLETFCMEPEIRNIYSKFLWGFPLRRFDFIGIAEFGDAEVERFAVEALGRPVPDQWPVGIRAAADCPAVLDRDLRSRIERYHGRDMALYKRALAAREKKVNRLMGA